MFWNMVCAPLTDRDRLGLIRPLGQLLSREMRTDLYQCQRVAIGVGQHPVHRLRVEPRPHH
jgi:hypothetical protein